MSNFLGKPPNFTEEPSRNRLGVRLDSITVNSALIGGLILGDSDNPVAGQLRYNNATELLEIGRDDGTGNIGYIPINTAVDPINVTSADIGNINITGDAVTNSAGNPINIGPSMIIDDETIDSSGDIILDSANNTINASMGNITNLADPIDPQDAATRQYVLDTAAEVTQLVDSNANVIVNTTSSDVVLSGTPDILGAGNIVTQRVVINEFAESNDTFDNSLIAINSNTGDLEIALSAETESDNCKLFMGATSVSNAVGQRAHKTAIIAEGINNWARCRLHLCVNTTTGSTGGIGGTNANAQANRASISDRRITILENGNIQMHNDVDFRGNTLSGVSEIIGGNGSNDSFRLTTNRGDGNRELIYRFVADDNAAYIQSRDVASGAYKPLRLGVDLNSASARLRINDTETQSHQPLDMQNNRITGVGSAVDGTDAVNANDILSESQNVRDSNGNIIAQGTATGISMQGNRITNVATAVDGTDAVNVNTLNSESQNIRDSNGNIVAQGTANGLDMQNNDLIDVSEIISGNSDILSLTISKGNVSETLYRFVSDNFNTFIQTRDVASGNYKPLHLGKESNLASARLRINENSTESNQNLDMLDNDIINISRLVGGITSNNQLLINVGAGASECDVEFTPSGNNMFIKTVKSGTTDYANLGLGYNTGTALNSDNARLFIGEFSTTSNQRIDMDNNAIRNVGTPITANDAVPQSYVDTEITNTVNYVDTEITNAVNGLNVTEMVDSGGATIIDTGSGSVNVNNKRVRNVAPPQDSNDAVPRYYVDNYELWSAAYGQPNGGYAQRSNNNFNLFRIDSIVKSGTGVYIVTTTAPYNRQRTTLTAIGENVATIFSYVSSTQLFVSVRTLFNGSFVDAGFNICMYRA